MNLTVNPEYEALVRPLTADEYALLKDDIRENGILTPLLVNPDFVIIDGHHRYQIAEELELPCPPLTVRHGLTPEQERAAVIKANVMRRQLGADEVADLIVKLRGAGKSTREIAEKVGVSKSAVHRQLSHGGTVGQPERITGKDGKSRPAEQPRKKSTASPQMTREEARAITAKINAGLDDLVEDATALLPEGVCMNDGLPPAEGIFREFSYRLTKALPLVDRLDDGTQTLIVEDIADLRDLLAKFEVALRVDAVVAVPSPDQLLADAVAAVQRYHAVADGVLKSTCESFLSYVEVVQSDE
jgi:hypothetical protein